MLECPDKTQVVVLVEERHRGEPWVLKYPDNWLSPAFLDHRVKTSDRDQWSTERMGNNGKILLITKFTKNGEERI